MLSNIETSTVYSRTGTLCFPASKRRLRSFYNKINSLCVFYVIKSNKVIEPDLCLNLSHTLVTENYGGFTNINTGSLCVFYVIKYIKVIVVSG